MRFTVAVLLTSWLVAFQVVGGSPCVGDTLTRKEARAALRRAVAFLRQDVAVEGGYLWRYSADLSRREGERQASRTTAWVQPPGTPTVGTAFLDAYELIGDKYLLEAARESAMALVNGQLESGGWDYRIEFASEDRTGYRYRVGKDRSDARNTTTLDDNTTQSALRFLMRVDRALDFQDEQIHDAAEYALDRLLNAQYPNGAWPQRFSGTPDRSRYPVLPASYPSSWSRTHPQDDYRSYYTFNDNTLADMIETMFDAAKIYDDQRYLSSAEQAGEFILLAQMPEPQPAWAQQYNAKMQPAWARRFEPPAITGGESQGILRVLIYLFRKTGNEKYLKPIQPALDYLRRSQLPDGRLARFYELKTNRPLYFTREYELTYSDANMPTHYSFQTSSSLDAIQAEYEKAQNSGGVSNSGSDVEPVRRPHSAAVRAEKAVRQLDDRGAWCTEGRMKNFAGGPERLIECRTFVEHSGTIASFIAEED